MKYTIYQLTCDVTGKSYIGQTRQHLSKRMSQHKTSRNSKGTYLSSAVKKYGWDTFRIDTLATTECLDELNSLEEFYIKAGQTLAPNGYNLTTGGEGYLVHEDTIVKMSKPKTKEHKSNMSKASVKRNQGAERDARDVEQFTKDYLVLSLKDLGAKYDMAPNAVSRYRQHKGIPNKPKENLYRAVDIPQFTKDYYSLNKQEICLKYSVSFATICNWRKRFGIPKKRP